jgi:alkylhydroperoxidase/carboxymuconolactone decarboxylase family protein YurZ
MSFLPPGVAAAAANSSVGTMPGATALTRMPSGPLYVQGLKLHIENAVGYGATAQEILEVMEIASVLGIHAVTSAAPILAEELAHRAQPG